MCYISYTDIPIMSEKTGKPRRTLDPDKELRHLVTEVIRAYPKKRPQIAEELTAIVGQRITVHMLNDFTSESKKPARFPAAFLEALCEVAGDDRLQRFAMGDWLRQLVVFAERELAFVRDEADRKNLRDELAEQEKTRHA